MSDFDKYSKLLKDLPGTVANLEAIREVLPSYLGKDFETPYTEILDKDKRLRLNADVVDSNHVAIEALLKDSHHPEYGLEGIGIRIELSAKKSLFGAKYFYRVAGLIETNEESKELSKAIQDKKISRGYSRFVHHETMCELLYSEYEIDYSIAKLSERQKYKPFNLVELQRDVDACVFSARKFFEWFNDWAPKAMPEVATDKKGASNKGGSIKKC